MYSRRHNRSLRDEFKEGNSERGFTLMEIVVSAALIVVVLTTLLFGMRLLVSLWRKVQTEADNQVSKIAVTEILRSQFAALEPASPSALTDGFEGDAAHVKFTTRFSSTGRRSPGLWSTTVTAQEYEGKAQILSIRERPLTLFVAGATSATEQETVTTLAGSEADRIEFSYLSPESATGPATWVSEWRTEVLKEIPLAVRVHSWRGREEEISTFPIPVRSKAR